MKKYLLVLFLSLTFNTFAEEKTIVTSDGVELHITMQGQGTPCLFIHGGPGSGSYWFEKFMGDSLEQHFQMIYLDQRGVGRSSSPEDGNYSLDRMVQDFEEIKTELGIKEWLIMGHSFAGIMQMDYALKHPESIKGIIMINCTLNISNSYKTSWYPKARHFLEVEEDGYYLNQSIPLHTRWDSLINVLNQKDLMWQMGFESRDEMLKIGQTYGDIPNWNWDFGAVAMTIDDYQKDFVEFTSQVHMPVLFVYGKKDWMVGPEHFKKVKFPNMLLWGIDGSHMPFFGKKAELMKAIEDFCNRYKF
ncbi:alpha/beta fold hydrolase [Draconibacterium sp.]|uniref:alpha/beta fold hydrolase n=1 Tax=Draconibacterium sp. TaxID=1965318 RepID=UPI003567C65E